MSVSHTRAKVHWVMRRSTYAIGALALVLLVILATISLLSFGQNLIFRLDVSAPIDPTLIVELLDIVLLIFIVIELLNIALALIEERRVIYTVFEAVLVAVARKIIASGTAPMGIDKGASLALITLAVGVTWWLVTHADLKSLTGAESLEEVKAEDYQQTPEQKRRRAS